MTATKVGPNTPLLTALLLPAACHSPPALQEQLQPGGKLIIPIGLPYSFQELLVLEKDQKRMFSIRNVLSVPFVPLTHAQIDSDVKEN